MKRIAIKATDKDMKCRGFKFNLGQIHEMSGIPRLCSYGFHFCDRLSDVFEYYKNDGQNRFFKVEILGEVDEGDTKSATNKIRFIEEVFMDDEKSDEAFIISMNNKGYVLVGSRALIMHGYKLQRKPNDFDFITSNPQNTINKDFEGVKQLNSFSGRDFNNAYIDIMGRKIEIRQSSEIFKVKREYNGKMFILQDASLIWEAKLKYALDGSKKHMNDIRNCQASFKFYKLEEIYDNDMPF